MKSKAICAALAIVITFPAALTAQQVGFAVGLGSRHSVVRTHPRNDVPYNRVAPRRGTEFPGSRPGWSHRGGGFPGGSVVIVSPRAVKTAPGHEPRTPRHPVATPTVTVVTPGNGGFFPGGRQRSPYGRHRGVQIIQPGSRSVFGVPTQNFFPGIQPGFGIVQGTSRADVIAYYGNPSVQILNRNSETMIFGGTTIIIENGVVALIR